MAEASRRVSTRSFPHHPRTPSVSALAVTALVVSLCACCPFLSLAGSVLGMAALGRIIRSGEMLRGRKIAEAAIIIGLISATVSGIAWTQFLSATQRWLNDSIVREVGLFVGEAQAGRPDRALRSWSATNAPSEVAIRAFGEALLERYGSLRAFRTTSVVATGRTFGGVFEVAGTFDFEHRAVPGSADFVSQPGGGWLRLEVRLQSIHIEDRLAGDLSLGEALQSVTTRPAATTTSKNR